MVTNLHYKKIIIFLEKYSSFGNLQTTVNVCFHMFRNKQGKNTTNVVQSFLKMFYSFNF